MSRRCSADDLASVGSSRSGPRGPTRLAFVLAWVLVTLSASIARAADPGAEATFQEGLRMLGLARFEEACRLLEASYALEPRSGTLVVLASCHAELGKTATAWAEYKEAAALARAEGRPSHADKANELAAELATRLSTVQIEVGPSRPGGLIVVMDGAAMPMGAFAIALPKDPGEHVVDVSAPGRRPWRERFILGSGERRVVTIPELDLLPVLPAAVTTTQRPSAPPRAPPVDPRPTWPWVVGGGGVVALGASAAALGVSASASAELDDVCSEARNVCPLDYDEGPVRTAELAGFGLFVGLGVAGLAGIATGVTALLTQPDVGARVSASTQHARVELALEF